VVTERPSVGTDYHTLLVTSDSSKPATLFGYTIGYVLGRADDVDFENRTPDNIAVTFGGSLATVLGGFADDVNAEGHPENLARAIASTTVHEFGHTVGLIHTTNPVRIMTTNVSSAQLISDLSFGLGETLEIVVSPLGTLQAFQDSDAYLQRIIGPAVG
jgi:hypothetical protein